MTFTRKLTAAASISALLALPIASAGAAPTHHSASAGKAAKAACRAELKKKGSKKFAAKYGDKNAFGKCVSSYEKHHKA